MTGCERSMPGSCFCRSRLESASCSSLPGGPTPGDLPSGSGDHMVCALRGMESTSRLVAMAPACGRRRRAAVCVPLARSLDVADALRSRGAIGPSDEPASAAVVEAGGYPSGESISTGPYPSSRNNVRRRTDDGGNIELRDEHLVKLIVRRLEACGSRRQPVRPEAAEDLVVVHSPPALQRGPALGELRDVGEETVNTGQHRGGRNRNGLRLRIEHRGHAAPLDQVRLAARPVGSRRDRRRRRVQG